MNLLHSSGFGLLGASLVFLFVFLGSYFWVFYFMRLSVFFPLSLCLASRQNSKILSYENAAASFRFRDSLMSRMMERTLCYQVA